VVSQIDFDSHFDKNRNNRCILSLSEKSEKPIKKRSEFRLCEFYGKSGERNAVLCRSNQIAKVLARLSRNGAIKFVPIDDRLSLRRKQRLIPKFEVRFKLLDNLGIVKMEIVRVDLLVGSLARKQVAFRAILGGQNSVSYS